MPGRTKGLYWQSTPIPALAAFRLENFTYDEVPSPEKKIVKLAGCFKTDIRSWHDHETGRAIGEETSAHIITTLESHDGIAYMSLAVRCQDVAPEAHAPSRVRHMTVVSASYLKAEHEDVLRDQPCFISLSRFLCGTVTEHTLIKTYVSTVWRIYLVHRSSCLNSCPAN